MSEKNLLYIPKIENGIVIDHIPSGEGIKILEIIHSYPQMKDVIITFGLNYLSTKFGSKDMLKIQIDFLDPKIIQHVSLVVPGVTIKSIKNYQVYKKIVIQPPDVITNLLECRNPKCITRSERHLETVFQVVDKSHKKVKCNYCERVFNLSELETRIQP